MNVEPEDGKRRSRIDEKFHTDHLLVVSLVTWPADSSSFYRCGQAQPSTVLQPHRFYLVRQLVFSHSSVRMTKS